MNDNFTMADIRAGMSASVTRSLSRADVDLFAVFGGAEPPPLGEAGRGEPGAHAGGCAPLVLWLLCNRLPGTGTVVMRQDLQSRGAIAVGDAITVSVAVGEVDAREGQVVFDCRCVNQHGLVLIAGKVTVAPPREKVTAPSHRLPDITLRRHDVFAGLLDRCKGQPPVTCAVVHPCDHDSLLGPLAAARHGLIVPILVGPASRIRAVAAAVGADLGGVEIVDVEHSEAAAQKAVEMARTGVAAALMKGSLHTDELMGAVVAAATGLRTSRRISHVFVMDVPAYERPLLVTDGAINIAPTLETKVDIVQNAIHLAHVLGIAEPKVAILSAVETVNPKIPSTMDAAMLCKMADRGQITGALLDGPLAFDNAISVEAATTKHIVSPVAGRADVLVAPDLEAGNLLAKQMSYFAGADSAGIVLGTRVPVVLTSRADNVRSRLASAAVMALLAGYRRPGAEEGLHGG